MMEVPSSPSESFVTTRENPVTMMMAKIDDDRMRKTISDQQPCCCTESAQRRCTRPWWPVSEADVSPLYDGNDGVRQQLFTLTHEVHTKYLL
jgi:hypothetical protein